MEELIQLAFAAQELTNNNTFIVDKSGNLSKTALLYTLILDKTIKNDNDAYKHLYENQKKEKSLKKLKHRLKLQLYNSLFLIDSQDPKFTDRLKAIHEINRRWSLFNLLFFRTKKFLLIEIAESTIKKSIKFETTEHTVFFSKYLMAQYGFINPNTTKYRKYTAIFDHYSTLLYHELRIERFYCDISTRHVTQKEEINEAFVKDVKQSCDEFLTISKTHDSFVLSNYGRQLLSFYYTITDDIDNLIKTCKDALDIFENKPYTALLTKHVFSLDLTKAYIKLKQYDEIKPIVNHSLSFLSPYKLPWLSQKNLLFLTYSFEHNFNALYILLHPILISKDAAKFTTNYQSWLIKESYVHILIALDKIDEETLKSHPPRNFRLSRFLNEVPAYSTDKRGQNISILIAQMLFLLIYKKYDQILDRLDTLYQYCHRYLRKDSTLRANCFIHMLLKLPDGNYNPIRVQRYAAKYHKKLKANPRTFSNQFFESEIIDYETLWGFVIELLEKQRK